MSILNKACLTTCCALGAFLASASLSQAAVFTEGNVSNGSASNAVGQSFTVGAEPTPDPSLGAGTAVLLNDFTLYSGGGGVGNAETRLVITEGAFFDFDGEDGTFIPTLTSPGIAGASSNTIDTASMAYGEAISFQFGAGLELDYGSTYSAVLATINASDEIAFIPASVAFISFYEESEGVWAPVANYGGTGNYNTTSLFYDSNADGYLEGATDGQDLSFVATFTAVPEPASLGMILIGLGAIASRRVG